MATEDLVIDASVAVKAAIADRGFVALSGRRLHAPTLLLSEAGAALRQLEWRGEISSDEADGALGTLLTADIRLHGPTALIVEATAIARELGWAKTYDAEYIALARSLGGSLMTLDARMARAVDKLVSLMDPVILDAEP